MFKKLKDKIAEEVKQSPLKSVQQLAQAVVSPSSSSVFEPSSSNDKFCIEEGDIEEDEKQEQAKPGGFTSVTLTGQTTSPVKDQNQRYGFRSSSGSLMAEADNLFPKFEPQPTNFHVQSDWESASEVEDRYSQLEHINKESLYEAYRKVYNRYNRIKNKYHEIVTHYRQLEREKEKAKTVLSETQDKALLRISELREQCLLEQQAKAHLEEALRNELEERDHIINTLRTKVQYLKGVSDSSAAESVGAAQLTKEDGNLIDFTENLSVSSTVPLPFDASSSEEKINWFEEKLKMLKNLLNEETVKVEQLKSKLMEVKKESRDPNDINLENVDGSEPFEPKQITEKELITTLTDLITKLTTEVQHLHKSAVNCSMLKSVNNKASLELRIKDDGHENFTGSENTYDVQNGEMNRYIVSIKQLEEQNKILSETLQEERFTAKELKNELNTLCTVTDILKKKIKLSNDNFGKNDAINCLITDVENELIHEWNSCFKNFLQTRCEITVLKDTREDLEKELLRTTEEKNKSELLNKEITEKNNKLKEDVDILQKELKSYIVQLENLSKERSYLKVSSENFEKQIKNLEKTLTHSEKANSERQGDVQKVINEKAAIETKLSNLELELQNAKSEYILILNSKQNLDVEVESLRKQNSEMISVNEALNNKVNEVENKLKQVEDDYKTAMDTRDGLDNQINSLTKETEELVSEKSAYLAKMLDLEKDFENNKLEQSLLLEEKEKLLREIKCIKDDYEMVNKEKLSIADRFHGLVKELENNKHNYSKSVESAQQHSDELVSLREEMNKLTLEKYSLESKIETLNKDIENLKSNCRLDEEVQLRLSEELSSVTEERDNLLSEIQSVQNRNVELVSASKVINEELSLIKKENTGLTSVKNNMQDEIQRLEECLRSIEENYSSLSKINMTLTEELDSLKKEKEGLVKEKSTLENLSKTLEDDLSTSKEKLSTLSDEHDNVVGKLQVLLIEYNELASKKQTEQDSAEKIKYYLKENEEKLLLISQEKNKFLDEIETLKNKFDQIEKEHKLLQDRYDRIVAEYENNKKVTESLTVIKDTMSTEIDSLKKENENAFDKLSKTIAEVEKQQNINSELEDRLCSLSESFKNKSDEANEKCKENIGLKREIKSLNREIDHSNNSIEKLINEKDYILNYIITNMVNVKRIKEWHEYLCDYVRRFQAEISREMIDINFKMGYLLKHLNDQLDPATCGTKLTELDCRSKKDIDSYNCKLKNIQGPSNKSEEVLQVTAIDLESSNPVENDLSCKMVKFRRMGHLEKAEMDDCISCDQKVHEPDVYLKQAISLMKSFTNLLNHNSVSSEDLLNSMFTDNSNNQKYIRLNEIESQNLQKEIVAMESFITDYETKFNVTDSSNFLFHMFKETDNDYGNYSEMQLRQELSLKEDIIKKLQSVIEDYEQKKVRDENEAVNSEKAYILEQENKSLSEKLQQIQETHELNMKNIVSEYEKKLKEIEEDNNLYDLEKLDKENKYVVNEMKEQIQNLQQEMEERGDAFEKLYEEHHQSVKNVDEEIHQMRNNHDKELREQDKKWRQCLDRRLAEEETRHQQELASLNMQWNAERRELETARRLALNAVESGSGSNELLRRQVQALTMQLSELRSHRCEACDRKRRSVGEQEHELRSIQDCTEMEYLRNILYEYMMGKEPLVLAKVLCALVKFDENQTKEIVSKEEHRITLFGQLGLL